MKCLTLSYDDGVRQDRRLSEILDKHGIKATFNLNSAMFDDETAWDKTRGVMSMEEVKSFFENSPHELAIHGLEHAFETELHPNLLVREIIEDRANLEKLSGRIIRGMAYPYGVFNDDVVDALNACGIAYSRTTKVTHGFNLPNDWLCLEGTCHHSDSRLDELCDQFLSLNPTNTKMFYMWGHSYEFDWDLDNNNWGIIEKFAEKMGNHDDIWYATNIEIYDYVQAYKALQFSTDQSKVFNPTSKEIFFVKINRNTKETFNFSVKPGETLEI